MNLSGATAIVTGGSRGLGPAIAEALAARGARVALAARSEGELAEVAKRLRAAGAEAVSVPADVTSSEDRARIVRAAEAELGPVDVLVNNAGFERMLAFADHTDADIDGQVDLNVTSLIQMTRLVLPGMVGRGRGHVVNMGSIAGVSASPFNTVYTATKHAVRGFTISLRAELRGSGVSASVVEPGFVRGAGMYERNWRSGKMGMGTTTTVAKVQRAVVRAIEKEVPEIVVAGFLGKISDLSLATSPRMTQRVTSMAAGAQLRAEAETRREERER